MALGRVWRGDHDTRTQTPPILYFLIGDGSGMSPIIPELSGDLKRGPDPHLNFKHII